MTHHRRRIIFFRINLKLKSLCHRAKQRKPQKGNIKEKQGAEARIAKTWQRQLPICQQLKQDIIKSVALPRWALLGHVWAPNSSGTPLTLGPAGPSFGVDRAWTAAASCSFESRGKYWGLNRDSGRFFCGFLLNKAKCDRYIFDILYKRFELKYPKIM